MTKEELKARFVAKALSYSMGADEDQLIKEAEEVFEQKWRELEVEKK